MNKELVNYECVSNHVFPCLNIIQKFVALRQKSVLPTGVFHDLAQCFWNHLCCKEPFIVYFFIPSLLQTILSWDKIKMWQCQIAINVSKGLFSLQILKCSLQHSWAGLPSPHTPHKAGMVWSRQEKARPGAAIPVRCPSSAVRSLWLEIPHSEYLCAWDIIEKE